MKRVSRHAVMETTGFSPRFSILRRCTAALLPLAICAAIACCVAFNYAANRPVLAQTADLQAIAKQYPKYTKERQTALLRAQQEMAHPGLRGVSILKLIDRFLKASFKPRSTTAAPPLAPFSGNLTAINAPGSDSLYLMRQTNCSLTLTDVYYGSPSGGDLNLTVDGSTPNYGGILHTAAGLSTTAGTFPNGCSSPILGISTRGGVYLGTTAQNLPLFAGARYDPMQGVNALYYATYNPSTGTIAYTADTSDPNINAVTAGDLNGDGLADVVAIDQLTTSASVSVRLANSDGTIAAGVSYPVTGTKAEAATVDDVNGDGKADVIVASIDSSGQEYVSVLTGNGDGTLDPAVAVAVPSPSYPTSTGENGSGAPVIESLGYYRIVNLITADLRGTGHKDIVASNGEVLLNNGSGAFTPSATVAFPAGNASSSNGPNLAAGDLNGDHKQDIVLCDGSGVSIYLGNGDGTFTPGQSYASIGDVGYVTITDLDGDGNADVYVGLGNGPFLGGDQFNMQQSYALMGNGDGSLRGAADLPFVYTGSNLADLNNDGKLDAVGVTASALTDIVSFTSYLGKGDGTFSAKATLPISPVTVNGATCYLGQLDSFALGDINGDGFADIVYIPTPTSCNSGFFVATGKGDGSFNTPVAVPNPIPYGSISGIQVADINHDGKADIVYTYSLLNDTGSETTSTTNDGIGVQLSNGDGTFQAPQLVQTSSTLTYSNDFAPPTSIAAIGDVNGDGFPDIFFNQGICGDAACNPVTGDQLELLLGKGDGTFQAPYILPANAAATGGYRDFSQIVLADMNGDGHPDVVALSAVSLGGLGIYLGKGDGTFSTPSNVNYAGAGLAIADFNGDGKLDVAISQAFGGSGIFFGNGDGTVQSSTDSSGDPQPSQTLIFGESFSPAVAEDFNGDGKADILFGSILLLNQVSSATAPTLLTTTTSLTASPAAAPSGQNITFTATVAPTTGSGTPTGTVTFYDGTSSLGTVNLTAGVATFSTSSLAVATHTITAAYSGDSTYNTSTSAAVTVAVTAPPVATTTTLTASASTTVAGTSLTFTAAVAPATGSVAPTGTVTFYDGTSTLGTSTLASGTASYSTAALAVGHHSITAAYGGDAANAASTSSAVTVTITEPVAADFSIALAPSSGTVAPGSSTKSTISIAPTGGFNQQVTLACAGAPKNATCTIAPGTVTPSGPGAVTATLTLQTNVNTAALDDPAHPGSGHHPGGQAALAFAGLSGLLAFASTRKRRRALSWIRLAMAALLFAGSAALGCGGSSHTTPGGTSTLTITATAGAISHTATYAVTVQ